MRSGDAQIHHDRTAGWQSWRCLSFLHWRVAARDLQRLVPPSLTIQTFDGSAWLGLVPFAMHRVRPWWSPPVPGISWFLETNVRTYVIDQSGKSGVWFFSLDANRRIAVSVARRFWHLPYVYSRLTLDEHRAERTIQYAGTRIERPIADYRISVELADSSLTSAVAATLEDFLIERYVLFTADRNGRMRSGRVHHPPYSYVPATECRITQSLTAAFGCPITDGRSPDHAVWSPGVDVRVSPLVVS